MVKAGSQKGKQPLVLSDTLVNRTCSLLAVRPTVLTTGTAVSPVRCPVNWFCSVNIVVVAHFHFFFSIFSLHQFCVLRALEPARPPKLRRAVGNWRWLCLIFRSQPDSRSQEASRLHQQEAEAASAFRQQPVLKNTTTATTTATLSFNSFQSCCATDCISLSEYVLLPRSESLRHPSVETLCFPQFQDYCNSTNRVLFVFLLKCSVRHILSHFYTYCFACSGHTER